MLRAVAVASIAFFAVACSGDDGEVPTDHGPMAEGIYARLGEPVPYATEEQRETFARGLEVAKRRFDRQHGLGPAFNVTFCGSCHERPVFGGSAGLYRNFFLTGIRTSGGVFFPGQSAGMSGGVMRMYYYGDEETARPLVDEDINIIAQRNPIPFFGVGLLAEIDGNEIMKRADPDDANGDGISGRPNFELGFVGRFGRKAQTASIEGFIRGPLFNHLGITTDPLTDEQRAALPVDSSSRETVRGLRAAQAAVLDDKLEDEDGVPDPEMSTDDLFDIVSFSMLLAPPMPEPPTEQSERGRKLFDQANCGGCHTPRLESPRGPLPVYSDLLIHDMGDELADGLEQREALGNEFRTQPLWGLASVGPYLHDGRATTIEDAILMHGGEAQRSRDVFAGYDESQRADVVEFLNSLGGRDQYSPGLLPPGEPMPAAGEYGGPVTELSAADAERFSKGRDLFDREFGYADGVGGPRFNGDSCRACHFDPVLGGSGPRGVNVMRHGILNTSGDFAEPAVGTILHKSTGLYGHGNVPQSEANIFEHRQTPHLFGLGLIDDIPVEAILANADPEDREAPFGISGKVSYTDDGRVGRFGWKGQIPSVHEFVRDAISAELGMTVPYEDGLTFGRIHDNDDIPDPESNIEHVELLTFFLRTMAPPPRQPIVDATATAQGEALFDTVGCAGCHIPSIEGVPLYSDLLLHEILPADRMGIEEASATVREFRTAPLWGIAETSPYLHDGSADTIEQAITGHDGEASAIVDAYGMLTADERTALLLFLGTL